MQTIYQAELKPELVKELAHDYPLVFGIGGLYVLEIWDWDGVLKLCGPVEVYDNEDGQYLTVDGWTYPLTEA